jgi:hypothetical protein
LSVDVAGSSGSQENPDRPRHREIVSASGLSGFSFVEQHEIGVRLDGMGQRSGLSDVEIAPKLDEQRRIVSADDIEHASVVDRSSCVHARFTLEEFVLTRRSASRNT